MSVCNEAVPNDDAATVFTALMKPFPYMEGAKIETEPFLDASKCVLILVDKLGKVFVPVRKDMEGNINKIEELFVQDKEKHKYLEDMVLLERSNGAIVVTEGLQWLRRGLHFLQRFLEHILANLGDHSDLTHFMKLAYEDALQPYHNWLQSKLFRVVVEFAPTRSHFFYVTALEKEVKEEVVLKDMETFVTNLRNCVKQLTEFYTVNSLET